jgi:hypothetical protein
MQLLSADENGWVNWILPPMLKELSYLKINIVHFENCFGYKFAGKLEQFNEPYVLIDYSEVRGGWSKFVLGETTKEQNAMIEQSTPEWARLDRWVAENPPIVSFKLNMPSCLRRDNTYPIEYPAVNKIPDPCGYVEWINKFDVFYSWGLTGNDWDRQRLHGEIMSKMGATFDNTGLSVADSFDLLPIWEKYVQSGKCLYEDHLKQKWATIYTPYYNRIPISEVLKWQAKFKISVAMPGNASKCYRHTEAPIGSIMAMWNQDLEWAYPWVHMENCIKLEPKNEFIGLKEALSVKSEKLYKIYQASQETIKKYHVSCYAKNYIVPKIKEYL